MSNTDQEWPDIMYTVRATPHEHYVDYAIYEITGLSNDAKGNPTVPHYQLKGGENYDDTDSIDNAKVFAHGTVKWDGCSDWMIDSMVRNRMLHGCGRSDITNVGEVLARCWDWTESLIPDNWMP